MIRPLAAAALGAALAAVPALAETGTQAPGAVLRWLDKIAGTTGDLELSRGQVAQAGQGGRLTILLDDCRYPAEGTPTDAFAHLVIHDSLRNATLFSGWMLAEAPALNALDHHRYDVWVLRCLTE
ncbi:MAG TPA: DUF2155 domain-containing protein [Paracoccaceae bacterium]|nr:DUF2155 domain-containing protein [Paracoccaceae bacterium]HMO70617.1 DUF2155 domain-containing protein [Paracoccaceae bacterium]HMO70628.1 DUF2155 domain-containing protein [Paracoccaceae bacterium]